VKYNGDGFSENAMLAGVLVREFKHLAVDMFIIEEEGAKKLKVEAHFGKRKALASIRTVCSHVQVNKELAEMFQCAKPGMAGMVCSAVWQQLGSSTAQCQRRNAKAAWHPSESSGIACGMLILAWM